MQKFAVIYLLFYLDRHLKIWLAALWICLGSGNRAVCIRALVASPQIKANRECSYNLYWKSSQDTAESFPCTTDRSSSEYCVYQSICITIFKCLLCAPGSHQNFSWVPHWKARSVNCLFLNIYNKNGQEGFHAGIKFCTTYWNHTSVWWSKLLTSKLYLHTSKFNYADCIIYIVNEVYE